MSAENVILVTIRDKVATADKSVYVCGNSGFTVDFDFDSEWDEFKTKTARFVCDDASYVDVLFDGKVCPVPILSNTHRVRVGVYAGNLVTTTPAYITASKSILCDGGTPADPPDDVYNQLMEKLNKFSEEEFARIENEISQTATELTEQIAALGLQTSADIIELEEGFGEQITTLVEQDITLNLKNAELAEQIDGLSQRADTFDEQATALAENDSKLAEEDTAIKERLAEVEKWIDDKDYGNGISITSFSHDAGTREMGSTIKSLNLNWGFDRKPVTQTLNGEALDVNVRSKHVDGLSITMDKSTWPTWKLTATDTRNKVVSSSVSSFTFLNGVYWGAAAQPEAIDSAFILGLTKRLSSSKVTSITVNAKDGEYIWYCLPVRSPFGKCTFKVGGFEGGFTLVDTIDFTNNAENKYTEKYYIYRSDESGLGSTTVGVS